MNKNEQFGRVLTRSEMRNVLGGGDDDEIEEFDDGIVPKCRCACVSGAVFYCNCGYVQSCAQKKCGSSGWGCAG